MGRFHNVVDGSGMENARIAGTLYLGLLARFRNGTSRDFRQRHQLKDAGPTPNGWAEILTVALTVLLTDKDWKTEFTLQL